MKARILFILLATMSVALGQSTKNLNQFTELPEAPNAADWIYLWDSSSNISKKLSPANLFKAMPAAGLSQVGGVKRNVGGAGEFVSGIDASGNLVYGTPAGGGGGISVTGYRVPYGNGSGSLTSEAGFEYDALANKLAVTNVSVTDVRFGTDNITLSSPTPGVFYMTEGTLTGDELAFDLSSDNAIRIFSGTGVATVQYDGIDVIVPAEAYNEGTWNGSNEVPTKDAVRDKFESLTTAVPATLVPYGSGAGVLTTEAAFSYDSTFNILNVGSVLLGGGTAGWVSYGASTLSLETASLEKFTFDLATANTMKFTTDSGIDTIDFGSMGVKSAAAPTSTPTAMGALAVDLTKSLNTKTISSNSVITFSGSLANGQYSELRLENSSTSEVTISWAIDCYDGNSGKAVSSFTVPASDGSGTNGRRHVRFTGDGTNMLFHDGGGGINRELIDAKGDLLVGSADNTVIRHAVGSDGTVLTADSSEPGGIKWVTNSVANGVTSASPFTTDGAILVADGTGRGTRETGVAIDALDNVTGIQSISATELVLTTVDATFTQAALDAISTTQGTILYRNASDWVALAPGTAGQVLQSGGAGANPSWTAAGSGAAGVYVQPIISTGTALAPADSTTYYFGFGLDTTYANADYVIAGTGTVKRVRIRITAAAATTAETVNLYLRINDTTDHSLGTFNFSTIPNYFDSGVLSISVTAGDTWAIKMVCPVFSTNPSSVFFIGDMNIEQ